MEAPVIMEKGFVYQIPAQVVLIYFKLKINDYEIWDKTFLLFSIGYLRYSS